MSILASPPSIFISIIALFFTTTALADITKMSSSGLCHPPQSSWYDRTKNYEAFESLGACLSAGGALPKGLSRTANAASQEGTHRKRDYDRSDFGHGWDDADGDCKDSRAEALIATSTTQVQFADEQRCRVVIGRWISPFTNRVVQNAGDIDIDHIVPLAWAWERGANTWPKEQREQFANDPVNLLPVEASLNRTQGPDKWLPPAGQCGYVVRFFSNHKEIQPEASRSRESMDPIVSRRLPQMTSP